MDKQESKDNKLIERAGYYSRHHKMSIVLFFLGLFLFIIALADPIENSLVDDERFMTGIYIYMWLTAIASVYYKAKIEHIKSIQYYRRKLNADKSN